MIIVSGYSEKSEKSSLNITLLHTTDVFTEAQLKMSIDKLLN